MKKSIKEERNHTTAHNFSAKVERNEPIETISRSGWVKWGEDNLQPQFLNSLVYDNPVHGGIINQKVNFMVAGGLSVNGDESEAILNNFNAAFNLQEVLEANADDLETCNQFYVLYKKNFKGKWFASYMENSLIRVDEDSSVFHYSEDWSTERQSLESTGYRQIVSINNVDLENDTECLMQVQTRPKQRIVKTKQGKQKVTKGYYPIPSYSGALTSIKAGIKMSFFVYSEVSNGYKGGTWINLANGIPATADEEREIINKVKGEASDEDIWGGLVVTFSDGKEREPRISQINGNDLDKRYSSAKKDVINEIMIAHGVISQSLFGVLNDGLFGSKEEMETAFILFKESYIKRRQRIISEAYTWANKKLNNFAGTIEINDYTPKIFEVKPVDNKTTMSSDLDVISEFAKYGVDRNSVDVKYSKSYTKQSDEEFKDEYLKEGFANDLTDEQNLILSMLREGQPYQAINTAVGKGAVYLSKQLITLGKLGIITDNKGIEVTSKAPPTKDELKVMYSYELRLNAPDLVKGGKSRPFCEQLIGLNRLYTIDEINTISATIGRDVWSYRGGWYHNPNTDTNTPSCRHEWRQIIV